MFWKKDKPAEEQNTQPQDFEDPVQNKLSQGWLKVATFIEATAISQEVVESSLKEHMEKLRLEPGVKILEEKWGEVKPVEELPRGVKEAFSQFVEMEIIVKDFPMLMYFIMTYLPSSLEILQPETMTLQKGDAQNMALAVAALMHQYAAAGVGGVVLLRPDKNTTTEV
jgi:hypothetical protein